MLGTLSSGEEAQLMQTIEMFEVITQSQPTDYQSLEILKEAYLKLGRQKDVVSTSKKIAQAYLQLGQLSSAILEYETILQQSPDDPEVLAAMIEIESKASDLTPAPMGDVEKQEFDTSSSSSKASQEIDDGRNAMKKIFVDSRIISLGDFDASWTTPNLHTPPGKVIEPFVQLLADKAICPVDKALKMISDKTRIGYLPLDRYDIDMDMARSFPRETCRWCVQPFDRMSKAILVATTNPFNVSAMEELQKALNQRILWYLATPVDLTKAIKKVYR